MRTLLQDLRYGARMLLKGPVVSAVAALSLALGIAGATAMFALASGFFLQPLPFPDQDSMILVEQLQHGRSVEETDGVSMPNVRDLRESATALRSLAAYTIPVVNMTGGDQPEQIRLIVGTPNTLDVLGVPPWMGRGLRAGGWAGGRGPRADPHACDSGSHASSPTRRCSGRRSRSTACRTRSSA